MAIIGGGSSKTGCQNVQPFNDPEAYRRRVEEEICLRPDQLVFSLELDGQKCWVKRRPASKKLRWHRLQALVASLLRMRLFQPTVSQGGPESLRNEADRLACLREQRIPVPDVILCEDDFLVTDDRGVQLDYWLRTLPSDEDRQHWLRQAIGLLSQVHAAGLAHGRPMPRDMVIRRGQLTLIDLEEDPVQVMSLAEAQARDVWLFMNSAVQLLPDQASAAAVFSDYHRTMTVEAERALRRLVALGRPFSWFLARTLVGYLGSDLRKAVLANEVMAGVLHSNRRV
jgi:tRNA A-37 threonylcarbamoyl transferase component Bud32